MADLDIKNLDKFELPLSCETKCILKGVSWPPKEVSLKRSKD